MKSILVLSVVVVAILSWVAVYVHSDMMTWQEGIKQREVKIEEIKP